MVSAAPPHLLSAAVNGVLAIKPLATLAKQQARTLMINRAESIGVSWREEVKRLQARGEAVGFSPAWQQELAAIQNPDLQYPGYYTASFHAYEEGNLGWTPAMEVEVAAQAVHARIWPEAGAAGDGKLRQSYHDVLTNYLPSSPTAIADLGCGVGMSTEALQATFPEATVTGVDLSPYFLAVAQYRTAALPYSIVWHHGAAEATGLTAAGFDFVSACLVFHELPEPAAIAILQEAYRLLRPGGHFAIMDMNPRCETITRMPPFVLTLLKSTEPYLDEYFAVDFDAQFQAAGFPAPQIFFNSPRHQTLVAQKPLS